MMDRDQGRVDHADELEDLLAEALARFDEGGEPALAAFVAAHPRQATALQRGLRRCREMGLLGGQPLAANEHPERLGEYRLLRRIGSGGMGVVYEAQHEPLGRRVALKVIRPELLWFEGARDRFRREVDAIARLEHPAIVAVFAAGEHEGVPFFTMEMIDGVTVDRAVAAVAGRDPAELRGADLQAQLPAAEAQSALFDGAFWETAVRIVQQIALGLRHAHLRGIVHRDVKPSNVIVTPHGQAIVLDFGVAQVRKAAELTRTGSAPGSPAFMSPEQRRGLATDERTDVYSLAATAWQLLTLQRPFRDVDLTRAVAELPPLPRLGTQNRAVPRELDLVLRTAMDPDRERRYPDMGAFAADLQAVLERRPIQAQPLGLPLRTLRWCQRHRTLATASLLTAVLAAAMLVVLLVVQSRANAELERTNGALWLAKADLERANGALHLAKAELENEQSRTRKSLDTSLEALHSVLVALGNDRLRAVPQAEAIAHGVLADAAALFRTLLREHPRDEEVRWRAGRALQALAMSHERRGEMPQALGVLREALDVLGDGPGSESLHNVRGHAWKTLAAWLVDGPDRTGLPAAIERAEAEFAMPADASQRADALRARSDLCSTRSQAIDERSDPATAERWLREAVELQRACMAIGLDDPRDPGLLVLRLSNLGKFLQRQRRTEEALAVLEEALARARELPETGAWPPLPIQLAEIQEAMGNLYANVQDERAEPLLLECIAARERACAQFPNNLEFRIRLGGTLHNFGRLLYAAQRLDDALARFEQARDIQREALARSPGHPIATNFQQKHLEMVGLCQSQRRDGEALRATAVEMTELATRDPLFALRVADFFLRAWHWLGRSDGALLDRAMAQLLAAEERGLAAAQLPKRGFEALADRDDYRRWRERVGKVAR